MRNREGCARRPLDAMQRGPRTPVCPVTADLTPSLTLWWCLCCDAGTPLAATPCPGGSGGSAAPPAAATAGARLELPVDNNTILSLLGLDPKQHQQQQILLPEAAKQQGSPLGAAPSSSSGGGGSGEPTAPPTVNNTDTLAAVAAAPEGAPSGDSASDDGGAARRAASPDHGTADAAEVRTPACLPSIDSSSFFRLPCCLCSPPLPHPAATFVHVGLKPSCLPPLHSLLPRRCWRQRLRRRVVVSHQPLPLQQAQRGARQTIGTQIGRPSQRPAAAPASGAPPAPQQPPPPPARCVGACGGGVGS
jgi:hypothetical protein